MSTTKTTQCRKFVQNAWKKELCSNCFKSREEHNAAAPEAPRPVLTRAGLGVKRVAHKVQGILRLKESNHSQVRSKRKNVAFPESVAQIIGYDGGDDFSDNDDEPDPDDADSGGIDVDELPDSEEERALGNLTRANTNFNTVTANLTGAAEEVAKAQAKTFTTLMLGRAPKAGDGKKTTVLVSVKPFGGDDSVPTAKRPSDKKTSPELTKPKPSIVETSESKSEISTVKPVKKIVNDKPSSETATTTSKTITTSTNNNNISTTTTSLGKIVDMPLITSTNLISVMRDESPDVQKSEQKRSANIARTPAIKKPENEKPRIIAQPSGVDHNAAKNQKNLEISNGVLLNLSSIAGTGESHTPTETSSFGKEIPNYKSDFSSAKRTNLADLTERKVEGEAANDKHYTFEQSRESAGEPDGKADEEVVAEPPALPTSPPPTIDTTAYHRLESPKMVPSSTTIVASAEPRASFLHGVSESKPKPAVPQKPVSLPSKPIGSSLASLLSEHRAYEYRLSQSQQRSNALMHSQSETQLCGVDEVGTKRVSVQEEQSVKLSAESCSQLTQMDMFKATCVKTTDKDEQTEDDLDEEDEDDSEASSTDQTRSTNKRRMAPQPPTSDDASSNLFARNPAPAPAKSDCPVVREKEKRERASSCSPKFRKAVCDTPDPCVSTRPPEPAPRRNISLSQDSLAIAANNERVVEEKKKSRSKFSLKKFLRMGSKKDVDMTGNSSGKSDEIPSTPQPKPRLEIIHPLELDGAAVQVLRNDKTSGEDSTDSKSEHPINSTSSPTVHGAHHVTPRPTKPPPPPRAQSLDDSSRPRAPPPKQQQQQQQQPQQQQPQQQQPQQQQPQQASNSSKPVKSWQPNSGSSASDSIYANLGPAASEDVAGAIRSTLAPVKPRRTSSMRDQPATPTSSPSASCNGRTAGQNGMTTMHQARQLPGVEVRQRMMPASDSSVSSESQAFECLSSSTECDDSSLELRQGSIAINHPITKRQSDSGALESNTTEMKFQQGLYTRSSSLPYCASEAESEIYSPFSCYNGDESEDGQEWKKDEESRIGRLRHRRGRSIVHRSLEDNYGAVIVANHEALAQFLEQTNQTLPIPANLRALKTANLQFSDFSIEHSSAVAIGRRVFFSGVWNEQMVTLCVSFEPSSHVSRREFYLVPIVEFIDTVPKNVAEASHSLGRKSSEATISVLPRLHVNTLKSFAELMSVDSGKDDSALRESSFVLLQLVSALKSLQAQGIEEAPSDLSNVVLCREDKEPNHRLYLFQGLSIDSCESHCGSGNGVDEQRYVSLCQCALNALSEMRLDRRLPLIRELLGREKAVTLSQVKSVLEFSLWGPADATLGGPRERETALQRWLDLERATVLHALVRASRSQLTVTDEHHLLFLVRTSAKIMCEASLLLDRQRNGLLVR